MSRDGLVSMIEECLRKIPPKQTGYLEYFERLKEMSTASMSIDRQSAGSPVSSSNSGNDNLATQSSLPPPEPLATPPPPSSPSARLNKIAASLWLVLLKPSAIESLAGATWSFRLDEHLLGLLTGLVSRGLLGAGDTIEVARRGTDGTSTLINSYDIMEETMRTIVREYVPGKISNACELKLIQLLLTASTSPNRALGGSQISLALGKLADIFCETGEAVNRNASRAAITQIVNERMEGSVGGSTCFTDQEEIFTWLCKSIQSERHPVLFVIFILDLIRQILYSNRTLFKPGEGSFARDLGTELLPTLLGSLNLKNDRVYDRLLGILETLVRHHTSVAMEMVEVLMVELFQVHEVEGRTDERAHASPFPISLLPFKNKMRAIQFIKSTVLAETDSLLALFLNYDCRDRFAPVVDMCIQLLLVLLKHSWHPGPDGEPTSAAMSTSPSLRTSSWDAQLRLAITEALLTFLGTLVKAVEGKETIASGNRNGTVNSFLQVQAHRASTRVAVATFNEDPHGGLQAASEWGLITLTFSPAQWVRFTRGIDKRAVGQFLGAPNQLDTLREFADTFDFSGLSFVASLRQFLEAFRLPGESQVVERFMEEFSRRYCMSAPEKCPDQDSVFQLAYSTLMLNTDIHSTSIRVKMTRGDFCRNTRRVVPEEKISDVDLEAIYEEIREKEIQLETDVVKHPLPLGSRGACHWWELEESHDSMASLVSAILMSTSSSWSSAIASILNEYTRWPLPTGSGSMFDDHDDLLGVLLNRLSEYVHLACCFRLEHELQESLGKVLASSAFTRRPVAGGAHTPTEANIHEALNWLHDVCEERGSILGSAWGPILECLANQYGYDGTSGKSGGVVPLSSSSSSLDLCKLDGIGLLAFFTALLSLDGAHHSLFTKQYLGLLGKFPASQVEKLLRISYEPVGVSGTHSLLTLLTRSPSLHMIPGAAPLAFAFIKLILAEHMPLLLYSLPTEGLLDLLRALEAFGLAPDVALAQEAIDGFLTVGELLLAQHGGLDGKSGGRRVDDEQFFMRWYHGISGLGRIAMEQTKPIAAVVAIEALLRLLWEQGALYQAGAWRVIWRSILFPLIEEMRARDIHQHVHLLRASCDLISQFEWSEEAFGFLLKYIESLCKEDEVALFEQALDCAGQLVIKNYQKHFAEGQCWDQVIASLQRIYQGILPSEVEGKEEELTYDGVEVGAVELHPAQGTEHSPVTETTETPSSSQLAEPTVATESQPPKQGSKSTLGSSVSPIELSASEANKVARKCALQILFLNFLQTITGLGFEEKLVIGNEDDEELKPKTKSGPEIETQTTPLSTLVFSTMSFENLLALLEMLASSHDFAVRFNNDLPRRQAMVKAGIASSLEMAVLNKQETGSLDILLTILYNLYRASLLLVGEDHPLPACLHADGQGMEHAIAMANRYHEVSLTACKYYVEMRRQSEIVRRPSKSWAELVQNIFHQWQTLLGLQDKGKARSLVQSPSRQLLSLPSKESLHSPSKQGPPLSLPSSSIGAAQGKGIWAIGERMVEGQFEAALEVMLTADRPAVQRAARDYVKYSHTRLAKFHLVRL